MKPSFDYLTTSPENVISRPDRNPNKASLDAIVDRATSVFGSQILGQLRKTPTGKERAFDLVDATGIDIKILQQVLDVIQERYGWVSVDRADPKGNYLITLTEQGRKYLDDLQSVLK